MRPACYRRNGKEPATPRPTTAKTTTTSPPTHHDCHAAPSKKRCRIARVVQKLPNRFSKHPPPCIASHIDKCDNNLGAMCEGCQNDELTREAGKKRDDRGTASQEGHASSSATGAGGRPSGTSSSSNGGAGPSTKDVALGTQAVKPPVKPRDSMEILPIPRAY